MPKPHRILFVCLGNICRSPAAEIIFRHRIAEAGRSDDFEVDSAGTIGFHAGKPPDPRMCESLERRGFPIVGRSRQIKASDLDHFDLILTMDQGNHSDVRELDPHGRHHHKIRPFVSYLQHDQASHIPDPYYGGQRGFDHVIDLLNDGCEGLLKNFSPS